MNLVFMGPIAFILDFFIIGGLAKKIAFGIVDMRRDNPFHLVLAISAVSVAFMCPCMSFAATVLIKHAPVSQIIPTWLQTTAMISQDLLADLLCRSVRKIRIRKTFPGKRKSSSFC